MGDTNRTGLYFVEESVWGTTPESALQALRYTGESLAFNIQNTKSNEIRDDRQITDLIQTGAANAGGFQFEVSYGAFDAFFAAALFGAWVGVGGGSTEEIESGATASDLDFTLASAGNTITLGSSVTHAIVAGQWIELTGSTSDDGYHFVTDVTGQVITVQSLSGDETLDETDAATIRGAQVRNGTTEKSFTIERKHADLTQFFAFLGMVPNQMQINAQADSILTGSFDFMGKSAALAQTSCGTGDPTDAESGDVMNAVTNVGEIMEGATLAAISSGLYIQQIDFTLNNNLREKKAVGHLGAVDLGHGELAVEGSFNAYFTDETLYDKYLAGTETGLSFKVEDSDGNAYIFTFPRIKFISDNPNAGGANSDVIETIRWQALRHATYDYTVQVCRVAASYS